MMPNPSVALVDAAGRPTPALLGVLPGLLATDPVVGAGGKATPRFRRELQARGARIIPNGEAQLVNDDGTPTRLMTALLMVLR